MHRDEVDPALILVAERAREYLATLDDAPLHSPDLRGDGLVVRRPDPGGGERRARHARTADRSRARRDGRLGRAAELPLRDRRRHPRRPRRRLARFRARPELVRVDRNAARLAARARFARLAPRPLRASRRVGRRAHLRRDDGQLRLARGRAPLVGGPARRRRERGRTRRAPGGADHDQRLHPCERPEGARACSASAGRGRRRSSATRWAGSISKRSSARSQRSTELQRSWSGTRAR